MTQRLNYTTIAPLGVKALGGVHAYVTQSNLPAQLVDLVYLRVSQIDGCAYCIDTHSRDLLTVGWPSKNWCSSRPGARQAPCSAHANVRLWLGLKQSRASPTPLYRMANSSLRRRRSLKRNWPT